VAEKHGALCNAQLTVHNCNHAIWQVSIRDCNSTLEAMVCDPTTSDAPAGATTIHPIMQPKRSEDRYALTDSMGSKRVSAVASAVGQRKQLSGNQVPLCAYLALFTSDEVVGEPFGALNTVQVVLEASIARCRINEGPSRSSVNAFAS